MEDHSVKRSFQLVVDAKWVSLLYVSKCKGTSLINEFVLLLTGQFHAIFSYTLKIEKTLFG